MPTYTLQGPSGKTYTVEGPEGASADQLGQFILSQSKDERIALERSNMREQFDPTKGMNDLEKVQAGIGKGMTDLVRGAGQWAGLVSRDDVAESRATDAPLMNTGAGKFGEFVGKAVPLAAASFLIPGAATIKGAAGIGAASGAVEPAVSTRETMTNIGLGAALGAAGQKIGNTVADKLAQRAASKTAAFQAQQAANAQRVAAAKDAASAGYVIPPSDIQPQGGIMEALAGLSGKIKTAQVASAKNQGVTDELARKAVGLTADDALTSDVLKQIRAQAGSAYDQFRNVGQVPADAAYNSALDAIEQNLKGAVRSFPGLKKDEVSTLVETMRQPKFDAGDAIDATKVLRGLADDAYSAGNKTLGKAYKQASGALEDSLERHLAQTAPDAVKQFREARQLIAKTYSVESALNSQTGNVSAQKLAAQLQKGKQLSGELLTIAKAGDAFKPAMQALKESPKDLSPLDFATAGIAAAGSGGNPLAALGLVARPALRSMLLSDPAQALAMRQLTAPTSRISNVVGNPLVRLLYGPGAAVAPNVGQ